MTMETAGDTSKGLAREPKTAINMVRFLVKPGR